MRIFLLLLGLIPVLALGLDVYFNDRAEEREARLASTATRTLIDAIGATGTAKRVETRRVLEADGGLWRVDGDITLEQAGQSGRKAYRVTIAQLCDAVDDDACWQPRAISLAGEALAIGALAEASPQPVATESGEPLADAQASDEPSDPSKADGAFVTAIDTQAPVDQMAPTAGPQGEAAAPALPAAETPVTGNPAQPADAPATSDVAGETATTGGPEAGEQNTAALEVAPAAAPAVPPPAAPAASEPVEMSLEESLIWLIQDRLAKLEGAGAAGLVPSGKLDPTTQSVIEDYRAKHGLPPGGAPSFDLLDHLDATLALQEEQAQPPLAVAANADSASVPPASPAEQQTAEAEAEAETLFSQAAQAPQEQSAATASPPATLETPAPRSAAASQPVTADPAQPSPGQSAPAASPPVEAERQAIAAAATQPVAAEPAQPSPGQSAPAASPPVEAERQVTTAAAAIEPASNEAARPSPSQGAAAASPPVELERQTAPAAAATQSAPTRRAQPLPSRSTPLASPPPELERQIAPAAGGGDPVAPPPPSDAPQRAQPQVEPPTSQQTASIAPAGQSQAPTVLTPTPLTPEALTPTPLFAAPAPATQVATAEATASETGATETITTQALATPEQDDPVDESLVFLIQDRLNRLGYGEPRALTLSGKLDARTQDAILAYQRDNQLSEDRKPSEALLRRLEADLVSRSKSSTAATER